MPAVWYEVNGSAYHSILTIGGLRFSRASACCGLSKMSGAAGTTLSISNDPAAGGVAISARRYAAVLTIPADSAAAVTLRLIGAGSSAVSVSGIITVVVRRMNSDGYGLVKTREAHPILDRSLPKWSYGNAF